MSKASAANEPSMEEILASIRRIISDEDEAAPAAAAAAPEFEAGADMSEDDLDKLFADTSGTVEEDFSLGIDDEPMPEMEEDEEDVLRLSADQAIEKDLAAAAHIVDPPTDIDFMEPEPEPEPEPEADWDWEPEPEPEPEPAPAPRQAAPAAPPPAFDTEPVLLSPTADQAVSNAFQNLAHTILSNNARTLEDLVKEMLRPMLKSWLDDNLPPLVERLVKAEIERVSRGGR